MGEKKGASLSMKVLLTGVRPQTVRRLDMWELLLDVVGEPSKLFASSDGNSTSQDLSSWIGEPPLPGSTWSWLRCLLRTSPCLGKEVFEELDEKLGFVLFTSHSSEFFEIILDTSMPCSIIRVNIVIFSD